jgi:flagellar L-ring protein FlgH
MVIYSLPVAACSAVLESHRLNSHDPEKPLNKRKIIWRATAVAGALLTMLGMPRGIAQAPMPAITTKTEPIGKSVNAGNNPAESSLETYLSRVRRDNKAVQAAAGAIWTDSGRLTRMSTDVRAMRPHDLISVVVSESLAASTDGTVKSSRSSSANSGISGFFGTLHPGNALQNLVTQNSSAGLNAQGASATNSSLTTTLGGQVVEVLPNGMLVIEAARQVEFSQQMQTIVLRGLVRPEDISQENQVLSTAISSLEVQVRGKGIINDYTHRQTLLVRLLQRLLVF